MISYKSLDVETWPDLQSLFGEKGACGGCWCMTWRLTNKDYERNKGANNKAKFHDLIKQGFSLGVLAFYDNFPIGWCSVSPRTSLIRLENSRLFKRIDEKPVWSISCLFVHKNYRQNGMSTKLIREAANYAFENGASIVEAYPIIPKNKKMPTVFAWVGFANAYMKADFKKIAQPSETRLIVRLEK